MLTITKAELQLTEGAISNLQGQLLATAAGKSASELIWGTGAVKGGAYLLNSKVTSYFTQADIDAGLVSFRHDGGIISTLPKLTLSAGGEKSLSITPVFTVAAVNDAPILAPKVTTLGIGKSLVLSSSLLGVKDEETALVDLQFTVKSSSHLLIKMAGIEQSTFSGLQLLSKQVTITQDGSTSSPALRLAVSDGQLETAAWIPLRFSAADKLAPVPVLVFSGLAVAEAAAVTLTRELFTGTTGSDDAGLMISAGSVKNGWFTLDGVKSTSFSLAEVDRGQVVFQHSGAEAAASFKLTLKSAQGKSAATSVLVSSGFTQVDDAPVLTLVKPVALTEGGTAKFGGNFKVTDGDTLAANLTFTVDEASAGQVELNGVKVTSFSAAALKSILFRHDGSETAPLLKLSVSDGHNSQSITLPVLFTRLDEAPTISKASWSLQRDGTGVVVIALKDQIVSADPDGGDVTLKVKTVSGGFFSIDGLTVTNFTQAQVDAGQVKFQLQAQLGATASWTLSPSQGGKVGADFSFSGLVADNNQAPVASNSRITINEEGVYSGVISAIDPEGGVVTFTKLRTSLDHGSYTLDSATGAFTYTGRKDANGADWFSVNAVDNKGKKTFIRVDVTINNVNDAPVFTSSTVKNFSLSEDGTVGANLVTFDADGDVRSTSLIVAPEHGLAVVASNGAWTYTPDANFNGADEFNVEVRDPSGATSYAAIHLQVNPVNDAFIWGSPHLGLVKGGTGQLTLAEMAISDLDGDNLSFTLLSQAQGVLKVSGTAASSFTLADLSANKVTFEHDGSSLAPSLNLRVSDGTVTADKAISIDFAEAAPAVTLQLGEIHLTRLQPLILTSAMITAADGVHGADGISLYAELKNCILEVQSLNGGWSVTDHFTMADVNAGKVRLSSDSHLVPHRYAPDFYNWITEYVGTPEVSFYASNGVNRSASEELTIKYNAPNHSPQLETYRGWIDMEHRFDGINTTAFVKLTTAMLNVTDEEDDADHLRYSSLSGVKFYLDGEAVDSFTQAQLAQGRIEYRGFAQELPFRVYDSAGISSFPKALHIYDDAMLMTNAPWGGHMRFSSNTLHYQINSTGHQFTDNQKSDILSAMLAVSRLVNVDFVEVSGNTLNTPGLITWSYSDIVSDPIALGLTTHGSSSSLTNLYFADVELRYGYFNQNSTTTGTGSEFYMTVLHELCHALGLQHPYNQENALYGNNTLLSYSNFGRFAPQSELTMTDIRTLQNLYGSREVGAGDDTLVLESPVTDPLAINAQYHFQEERSNNTMTLVDAGGNNTLDLRHLVGSYSFELNTTIEAGASSRVDFNTYFTAIYAADLAQGETGEIFGSERVEKIYGGSGIDILSGGGGEDEIDGGAGNDLIQLTDAKSIFGGVGDDLLLVGWRENHQSWSNVTDNYIDLSDWDLTAVRGFEGISIGQGMVKLDLASILAIRQGSDSTSPFLIEAREGGRLDLDMTDFVLVVR